MDNKEQNLSQQIQKLLQQHLGTEVKVIRLEVEADTPEGGVEITWYPK